MTIRSCGVPSAKARTSRAKAANIPTPGITTTWTIRAPPRPARSCRAYPWLLTQKLETDSLPARLNALRKIGVPYPAGYENGPAQKDLQAQAEKIVANLKTGSVKADPDRKSSRSSRICSGSAPTSNRAPGATDRRQIINRRKIYGRKNHLQPERRVDLRRDFDLHLFRRFSPAMLLWAFGAAEELFEHDGRACRWTAASRNSNDKIQS